MDRFRKDLTGGMPFEWDDLEFDENGILDAFAGLVSPFVASIGVADSVILSGAVVTDSGANLDVTAGWIAYNGEIVKVDAHSITDDGGGFTYWWKLVETFDPAGLETFEDTVAKDTYRVRRMVLTNDNVDILPAPLFAFDYSTLSSLTLRDGLGLSPWVNIDLSASLDVAQNDANDGTGSDNALSVTPQANSFLKYRLNGKTVNIQYEIVQITTVGRGTAIARALVINNLPFTFKGDQFGEFRGRCHNQVKGASGIHPIIVAAGGDKVIFQIITPQGTQGEFNEEYELAAAPDKAFVAKAATGLFQWTLRGSVTLEIN